METVGLNYAFYYIESNVFCVLVYAVLLYKTLTSVDRQHVQLLFCGVLVMHVVYFCTDIFWVLVDSATLPKTPELIYASNVINYVGSAVATFVTFLYMERYQENAWIDNKRNVVIAGILCAINVVLIITSPLTGLYFTVDATPELIDGPLYAVMLLITFSYLIVPAWRAFHLGRKPENFATRRIHYTIAFFPVIPIVAGVIQAFNWRVPWICYGLTLAVLYMYITFSDDLISQDPLTHLNNRNELNRHLAQVIKNPHEGTTLYFMILDADYFKQINDTYGHIEGDHALVLIADALREACAARKYHEFVARYGGDEFVVCGEGENDQDAIEVYHNLMAAVDRANATVPYELRVTIGWSKRVVGTETETIPGLIAAADADLYSKKHAR